jgi:hypothetical protein
MTEPTTLNTDGGSASHGVERSDQCPPVGHAERRLPFTARVAVEWMDDGDLPGPEDGQLRYWRRAPMTGNVVVTAGGQDVSFSDLEAM